MSQQHHDGDHLAESTEMFTEAFWDERYRSGATSWSGNPNPHLVEQIDDLEPGLALDVGSGDGADAIWLAGRGWQVTAADVSTVALGLGAERARAVGAEIADGITWHQADFFSWVPSPQRFDLVSAQFMHLPAPALETLHRRLAAAVRPGGTLLIVMHHPSDLKTSVGRWGHEEMFRTPQQIVANLGSDWDIVLAAAPEREGVDPDGQPVTIRDAVVRARKAAPHGSKR
ncbi:MAG: class I SAM-dependent methyltransferase [Actinomycetota bacterium]|nr:class I SAM-dependent methyltransferase [Actinomycetota bacterium]